MAVVELFALREQQRARRAKTKPPPDPVKRSLAEAMRALRRCLQNLNAVPDPGEELSTALASAVTDSYQRKSSKKARYRPPNPDKKPLGEPKIRKMKPEERQKLKRIQQQQ
jgi:hypothetical protein